MDLGAVCFGAAPWTVRRVLALVRHLPPDSALHGFGEPVAPSNDDAPARGPQWWTRGDEMMAVLLELTHANARLLESHATGKASTMKPLQIPRPRLAAAAAPERRAIVTVRGFNSDTLRGLLAG